jgi:hypothetical protein
MPDDLSPDEIDQQNTFAPNKDEVPRSRGDRIPDRDLDMPIKVGDVNRRGEVVANDRTTTLRELGITKYSQLQEKGVARRSKAVSTTPTHST